MFENVLSKKAIEVVDSISSNIKDFYLSGGTGLALQLGHRKSEDLDFFSPKLFNTEVILNKIHPAKDILVSEGTIHCEIKKVKLSFMFYKQSLVYPQILWRGLRIADWEDITAEKFKSVSQRGAKKDFYDIYAVLRMKLSIEEACQIFKRRFASSGINMYHVLKSITFFEDAEKEPTPILIVKGTEWEWDEVKKFFEQNVKRFKKCLIA